MADGLRRAVTAVIGVRWRKWMRALHRDVGYLSVALTLAYGLSGIAVNHIEDWNPKYTLSHRSVAIGPVPPGDLVAQAEYIRDRLAIDRAAVRGQVYHSEHELGVIIEGGGEARVMLATGQGTLTIPETRAVFFEVNVLHLNELKGAWTWIADGFAVALMFLAVTGMLMMKGPHGLARRGKWFVLAGLAVPVAAIGYMYS